MEIAAEEREDAAARDEGGDEAAHGQTEETVAGQRRARPPRDGAQADRERGERQLKTHVAVQEAPPFRVRPRQVVAEDDRTFPRNLDDEEREDGRDDGAVQPPHGNERDVQREVRDARDDRLEAVFAPQPQSRLEHLQNLPRIVDVEEDDHQQGRGERLHQLRTLRRPEAHERLIQGQHHRRAPRDDDEREDVQLAELLPDGPLRLRVDGIPEPRRQRVVDDVDEAADGLVDRVVVPVGRDGDEAEARRDDEVVARIRDDRPHAVQEKRTDVRQNLPPPFAREPSRAHDVGEKPARRTRHEQIRQHREDNGRQHVVVIVARQAEDAERGRILRDRHARVDVGLHVLPLVDREENALVGEEEIAQDGVREMDEVDEPQVDVGGRRAMHELRQKRQERKAADEDEATDEAEDRAVEAEVGADRLAVVLGDRLVEGADDGLSEAEFRKRQDAEQGCEEPVQAKVFGAHPPNEERAVDERQKERQPAVDHPRDDVPLRVADHVELHAPLLLIPLAGLSTSRQPNGTVHPPLVTP